MLSYNLVCTLIPFHLSRNRFIFLFSFHFILKIIMIDHLKCYIGFEWHFALFDQNKLNILFSFKGTGFNIFCSLSNFSFRFFCLFILLGYIYVFFRYIRFLSHYALISMSARISFFHIFFMHFFSFLLYKSTVFFFFINTANHFTSFTDSFSSISLNPSNRLICVKVFLLKSDFFWYFFSKFLNEQKT